MKRSGGIRGMIKTLVLAGGGAKGLAHIGVIKCLDNLDSLSKINHFVGASIGSIVAALAAAGATGCELEHFIMSLDTSLFVDYSWNPAIDLYRLNNSYGVCTGAAITSTLGDIFKSLGFSPNVTFNELYLARGRKLTIACTRVVLPRARTDYYSHETHPDMKIVDALRESCSIPFVFEAPQRKTPAGMITMCDGGLFDNFPMHLFAPSSELMGVKLRTSVADDQTGVSDKPVSNLREFISSIMNSYYHIAQESKLSPDYSPYILTADIPIDATDFKIDNDTKKKIIDIAFNETLNYMNKRAAAN